MAKPVDVILLVPKGSQVRYVESPFADTAIMMDASLLERISQPLLDTPFVGLPIHQAEPFYDDEYPDT